MSSPTAAAAVTYSQVSTPQEQDGLKLIDVLSPKENNKVLDIGCGTGYLTSILAKHVGTRGKVIGIDPDKERVQIASEKYTQSNLEFQVGDDKSFPEDQYNVIFSNYVIHWIKDKDALFMKVVRSLCPGGKFGFVTGEGLLPPVLINLNYLMGPEKGKAMVERFAMVPLEEYERLAASCGLEVTFKEIRPRTFSFPNIDALVEFWFGVMQGDLDPTAIDEKTLEEFKQQYGIGPVGWTVDLYTFVLTKADV